MYARTHVRTLSDKPKDGNVRARATRETSIESYLTHRVRELGGKCCKFTVPAEAGHPDRLIKIPGRQAALLELKRPRKEPGELQWQRMKEWQAVGMVAAYADTKEAVDRFLAHLLPS